LVRLRRNRRDSDPGLQFLQIPFVVGADVFDAGVGVRCEHDPFIPDTRSRRSARLAYPLPGGLVDIEAQPDPPSTEDQRKTGSR